MMPPADFKYEVTVGVAVLAVLIVFATHCRGIRWGPDSAARRTRDNILFPREMCRRRGRKAQSGRLRSGRPVHLDILKERRACPEHVNDFETRGVKSLASEG
jgi:hypothetical protein